MEQIIGNDDDLSQKEQISDKKEREAETDDERTSMNGWTVTVNNWQKQEKQWISYMKSQGVPMTDQLYADDRASDKDKSMNECTERVMTQTKIEVSERMKCEPNSDDRAKYEEKSDDKATLAPKEESSRNADGEESKVSEGHWPDWRSAVRLLAGALSRGRV